MTIQQQQSLDSFYALDNVITVNITMPQADWDAVRKEEPKGGRCNFESLQVSLPGARGGWPFRPAQLRMQLLNALSYRLL